MNDTTFQKYHTPKPCMFCSNMAGYSPLEDMDEYDIGVYFCHPCQAEYLFYGSDYQASVSIYTKINDKVYRWTLSGKMGTLWYVAAPGIPGKQVNKNLIMIKSFDSKRGDIVPQLTPENIAERIKRWLPFL